MAPEQLDEYPSHRLDQMTAVELNKLKFMKAHQHPQSVLFLHPQGHCNR